VGIMEIKVMEYTCDSCGKSQLAAERGEAIGYSGTVTVTHETGGGSGTFFACSPDCLVDAIREAIFNR